MLAPAETGGIRLLAIYISMLDTEGERSRISELYDENKLVLLSLAKNMLNNRELAEDAVHSAFLSIIESKKKYFELDSRNFRYLAVLIVKNKCIDILREQNKYSGTPLDEMEFCIEAGGKSVEEQVMFESEYEAVRGHLKAIDVISKQVLVMKYYYGMSYKEIGAELGLTQKQIDNRIMKAKTKVRNLIGREAWNNG